MHKDAEYVWDVAVNIWGYKAWTDVTSTVVPDFRNPNPLDVTTAGGVSNTLSLQQDLSAHLTAIRHDLEHRSAIVRYRVAAYERDRNDAVDSTELRLVSEVVDEARVDIPTLEPTDAPFEFLACVGTMLRERGDLVRSGAKDVPSAGVTVFIESLPPGAIRGETAARLEMISDSTGVRAQVHIEERPRIDLGPLKAPIEGDLWNAVAQLLLDLTGELNTGRTDDI
jgi:hypothetical protein